MKQNDFYEVDGCMDFIPVKLIEEHKHITNTLEVELTESGYRTLVPCIYKFPKVNEPQKVVVPKFVAEWIEECKASRRSLRDSVKGVSVHPDVLAWLLRSGREMYTYPNQEIFARAWLDGYEIEQERLYTVEIPDPNSYADYRYLSRNDKGICLDASNDISWKRKKRNQLTEAEIKQDFEWAWNAGFAKEVE